MKYDTSDVRSLQKFLNNTKELFDKINAKLPEDSTEKLDYDKFEDDFYAANEGLLKNRDALKQEKLSVVEEFDKYKKDTEAKIGSIDEKHKAEYNAIVKERDELKSHMKDGEFDVESMQAKFESEKQALIDEYDKKIQEQTKELKEANEALTGDYNKIKGNHFDLLKKQALSDELDRIKVDPEDRPLIMQANLSRAEIAEDKDKYKVVFKLDDDTTVDSSKYWDNWAKDAHNQRYILAEDNAGGGAGGNAKANVTDKKAMLREKANDTTLPLHERIKIQDELRKED
jgi:hypothetical protein